ncbi:hypothetical protein [Alkalihalobacillus sp. CinArs1]|uniref:hypothetical protein n=1 Tax=Alkalihalobacillus sp. CinArs1 TaxID=2995314 RepID=UPI0022DE5FA9|nr:hypothetical protein [Alkalihalobacillus sp. CinArs1]
MNHDLKQKLHEETYETISFSNAGKQAVLHHISSKKKRNPLQFLLYTASTVVVLAVFGAIILTGGLEKTDPSAVDEPNPQEHSVSVSEGNSTSSSGLNKEWTDVTVPSDVVETHPTSAKEMIASYAETLNAPVPEQHDDDHMYYKTIGATSIRVSLVGITVQGEAIEKDFENLKNLSILLNNEERKRYEHLNLDGTVAPTRYLDQWKEPSERMKVGMTYLIGLVNDLNITMNEAEGSPSGYSYMLDGDSVSEVEALIAEEELVDYWRDE